MHKRPQMPTSLIALIIRLKRAGHSEDGFIIFITVALVLLLGFLWTASALMSKVDTANVDAAESTNTGFYAAEYGLNKRAGDVRNTFEGYGLPSGTAPTSWQDCASGTGNQGTGDMACQLTTVASARSNRGATKVATFMSPTPGVTNPSQRPIPPGEAFAGLSALEYSYTVTSTAVNANRLNQPAAILGMQFKSRLIPLFQFAAFYNDDLDFYFPPDMTLNGRMHTNGNLYLNATSSATLSINGQVSAAGLNATTGLPKSSPLQPLIRGEKDNQAPECGGVVRIMRDRNLGWQNLNCNGSSTRTRYGQTTTSPSNISDWGANIQLGVPRLTVPAAGDFAPTAGASYWSNADLRIVLNVVNNAAFPSGTSVSSIEVQNADGTSNALATAALNSCSALDSAGTAITSNLTSAAGATAASLSMTPNTAQKFRVGDTLIVGSDWDGNVVTGPTAAGGTSDANAGNTPAVNTGATLNLRQQLRGTGQVSGVVVRKAVVSSADTFYNYREKYSIGGVVTTGGTRGQYIRMLNVDVRELMNCAYNQPNLMDGKLLSDSTQGGLVWYFTVKDNSGNTNNFRKYGIRLYNGRSLRSTIAAAPEIAGLTIISNQAVYVQGDYNLKDDSTAAPTTVADDPSTAGITETWKPAAIMADSVHVLSNRWRSDDFNSTRYTGNLPESQNSTVGKLICVLDGATCSTIIPIPSQTLIDSQTHRPVATATSINAAFLGGTFSPVNEGDPVMGGLNNYPRFYENWNTVAFKYRGSFVSLRQPAYNVAPFCGSWQPTTCNIYVPPLRNWDYENVSGLNNAGFNDAQNLPPMTPRAVYLRQEVFTRSYDRAAIDIFNPFAVLSSPAINFGLIMPGQR
jgi:hypothetical protein